MVKRRAILQAALSMGALSFLAPRLGFASGSPTQQRAALSEAWRRAVQGERGLLVLLMPGEDQSELRDARGQLLGEWLNHATDAQLEALGGAEVVCATPADLQKLLPSLRAQDADWFAVVQPARARGELLRPSLPHAERAQFRAFDAVEEAVLLERIQANNAAIQAALSPVLQRLAPAPAGCGPQVRAQVVEQAPAGAHWARSSGCGTDIEGVEPQYRVKCGMGHMPAASQRFLFLHDVSEFTG